MRLPNDAEAERAALGSVLLQPRLWPEVASLMHADDLYAKKHRAVYEAIAEIVEAGEQPDIVTVARRLGGDALFVRDLVEATPVPSPRYARIVAGLAANRRVIIAAGEIIERASDGMTDAAALASDGITRLQDAAETGSGDLMRPADLTEESFAASDREAQLAPAIPTGIGPLDRSLGGGLHQGRLYLIAARTSVGKSALAGNIVLRGLDRGDDVLFVSLEMSGPEVLTRLVADAFGIDPRSSAVAASMASDRVQKWPLSYLGRADLAGIVANTRQLRPRLLVVDYIQLVPTLSRFERRDLEVAHITRTLKNLAVSVRVPIAACAQLNRAPGKENRAPRLSDLRESGAQEMDADAVILLDRNVDEDQRETKLILAKNRQGPTGTVALYFDAIHTRFRELSRETG